MSNPTQSKATQALAASLRNIATRAAEHVGGGCALLFGLAPDGSGEPLLRAAAGFAAADAARSAARASGDELRRALSGQATTGAAIAELGPRGAGGTVVLPLVWGTHVHGALVVGTPAKFAEGLEGELAVLADQAGLALDHAHLCSRLDEIESASDSEEPEEDSEELLRLSEELFAQDIELLRSNEKLGKIEKLKNDFIEKMSRELRTPLNSIIEAIIAVLAGENAAISDHSKDMLRAALDEGTAFQRTLQNILDLWRIKQNELPVRVQDVNIAEVVDEAIFSIQDTLGDKPVRIEKDFDGALPKVKTDVAKINQLLFLLLDNAAKFTEGGAITIGARVHGKQLECVIRDTGIGICADDQQYVFDEFFQVDELSSQQYRGAGLGLALVRDLVVLLDGELTLDSEVGQGTTFRLQIPIGGGAPSA